MTFRLLFRSVRHEWPRLLSAVLGVAAATGLLAWHLGLACTAIHSGHDAAERASAPFSAWIGPPAPGPRPDSHKDEAKQRPRGRARATAEATGGRRMMGRGGERPIPPRLVKALEASPLVEKMVPLATIGVTMDVRPAVVFCRGLHSAGALQNCRRTASRSMSGKSKAVCPIRPQTCQRSSHRSLFSAQGSQNLKSGACCPLSLPRAW